MSNYLSETDSLRAEIAAAAARMIAEDGADYSSAKRKAARQILGGAKIPGNILPDNAQVENEVRLYQELFLSDSQPARLLHLRKLALRLMTDLVQFNPYLTGAALNGTAGEHSDIYIQLFTESPKEVQIFLLNKNIPFEVSETQHFRRGHPPVETVSFILEKEGIHLVLYELDDLRGAVRVTGTRGSERADIETVRALILKSQTT
jgi:hypothetical protein